MTSDFVYFKSNYKDIQQFEVGIIQKKSTNTCDVILATGKVGNQIPQKLLAKFDIYQTGDQFSKKICNRCGRLLPIDNFEPNQHGKDNRLVRRPSCKTCRSKINGINIPSAERKEWMKRKPQYIVWTCPICHKTSIPGITCKVVLDHNHHTGHPRAWICDSCNTGLGRFNDNINILKNAIKYLKNHDSSEQQPHLF